MSYLVAIVEALLFGVVVYLVIWFFVRKANNALLARPLLLLLALCSLPAVLFPLLQYLTVARYGSCVFLLIAMFLVLAFLGGFVALAVAAILRFNHRSPLPAARCWLLAAVVAVASVVGVVLGERVRMAAFHDLAERSQPLVQAIRSYDSRYGAPPANLGALVPEYLPRVPGTGMGAYPQYRYHVGDEAARYDNNPWVLTVFTPSGGSNFDMFIYFPLQNYPELGYGGRLERIGDWAYVHE